MKKGEYGTSVFDFCEGDRVELHPGCDLWMQGATKGVVHSRELSEVRPSRVVVKMDHPQVKRLQKFAPDLLKKI
jgi:hypothetical protein